MKKKIFIMFGSLIILVLLIFAGVSYAAMTAPRHPSDYEIGIKYEQAAVSEKPMLAVFYVDWCGYCMKFMPKFNILSKIYKDQFNFVMVNVEDKQNEKLATEIGIVGFPTVFIIDPKYDNKVLLSNAIYQNLSKFRVELDRYLRIRSLLDSVD